MIPAEIGTAAALRRAFDQGFAQPRIPVKTATEKLLGLRLGGDGYAVRVQDIAGLLADQKIVPLPSPAPHLLGITGRRGEIVPVYNLSALLGYPGQPRSARWIILTGSGPAVGLAFDIFEGHLALPAAGAGGRRTIIDLGTLLQTITTAAHGSARRSTKER